VVLDPDGVTVGSVHEDFAVEATIGDIFLLGTHSWQVKKVEVGTVRVHDAGQLPPTIPFWLGEAPARTMELSTEVSKLRASVEDRLLEGDEAGARSLVRQRADTSDEVADQVVAYLSAGRLALGVLPTQDRLVIERFFDESEGTQLIIHAPFGGAINRAFGLALRKRFCVSFDFELQASADDDTVSLSLGPQHSFPLSEVPSMLPSHKAEEALTQAVLPHPMFAARWRWNLNRALVVPRSRNGQRRPIHLQRMEADDLLAATWPALGGVSGERAAGADPGTRPRPGAPDRHRLPPRGARRGRSGRRAGTVRVGGPRRAVRRIGRAVSAGSRHLGRTAVYVPRRRTVGGTAVPFGVDPPRPEPETGPGGGPARARAPRSRRRDDGSRADRPRSPGSRRAPRPTALFGRCSTDRTVAATL
jgi:hypothetical protein